MAETEQSTVSYEELSELEQEFDDADLQIIRQQYKVMQPLYAKRQDLIAKIPSFWALVLEQVPPEIDQYIQPSDSKVFAECLKTIDVTRFEIDNPNGSPRSVAVKFDFGPNDYFEDASLEKKFWFRRAADGWTGLVSEPVKIHWKKGQDLTEGLTDAAVALWQAKTKRAGASNGDAKAKEKKLPEYQALVKKMELSEEGSLSFFSWFGYVSNRTYVSAEESVEANKKEAERRAKKAKGEKVEEEKPVEEEEEEDDAFEESEIFPNGEELANLIAEEVWPNALRYFTQAQEADDEDLSSLDEADFGSDDDDTELIDIRALVGKGKEKHGDSSPPAKKRRT